MFHNLNLSLVCSINNFIIGKNILLDNNQYLMLTKKYVVIKNGLKKMYKVLRFKKITLHNIILSAYSNFQFAQLQLTCHQLQF